MVLAFLNNGGRPWSLPLSPAIERIAYPFDSSSFLYAMGNPSRLGQAVVVGIFYLPIDIILLCILLLLLPFIRADA